MAVLDICPLVKSPSSVEDSNAEFQAGLISLRPFLLGFAMSLTRQRGLSEDLAQEALTKAWRSREAFIPGSNLKAWLVTILRNEYYSQRRRGWRQMDWDEKLAEIDSASPDQQDWALELSDLLRAMQALPDAQRKALLLVGAGGFSYEEAATHTGSPLGTVKSRVARAREALKTILDGQKRHLVKHRPAKGNAMTEIIAQVGQLTRLDASHSHLGPVA